MSLVTFKYASVVSAVLRKSPYVNGEEIVFSATSLLLIAVTALVTEKDDRAPPPIFPAKRRSDPKSVAFPMNHRTSRRAAGINGSQ
jgi:hypothetical protein